jgi:hypothetical protein
MSAKKGAPDSGVLTPVRDLRRVSRRFSAGDVVFDEGGTGRCRSFAEAAQPFEVDLHHDDGVAVDLGGITLEVGHMRGHCSHEADADLDGGNARLRRMIDDSHALSGALRETDRGLDDMMRSLRDPDAL